MTTASLIQGYGIGPAVFVVKATAADMADECGNIICKFTDDNYDTYIIISALAINTRTREPDNIETWAQNKNKMLSYRRETALQSVL